jgi:hypothetical protein
MMGEQAYCLLPVHWVGYWREVSQITSARNERASSRKMAILEMSECHLLLSACRCNTRIQGLDPYFLDGIDIDAPLPQAVVKILGNFASLWFVLRTIRIMVHGLQVYSGFPLFASIPAIICVSLGGLGFFDDFWGRPENWPPLMGNPRLIARSRLRGFWGQVRHQLFRNVSFQGNLRGLQTC